MPRGRWRRWRGFDGFSQKHGDAILMQMTGFEVGGWTFPLVTQQLNRTGPRGSVYVGVSVNYKTYFNHMRRRRHRFTGNQWINCKKHEEFIWGFLFFLHFTGSFKCKEKPCDWQALWANQVFRGYHQPTNGYIRVLTQEKNGRWNYWIKSSNHALKHVEKFKFS